MQVPQMLAERDISLLEKATEMLRFSVDCFMVGTRKQK